jgi:hypothetical protein
VTDEEWIKALIELGLEHLEEHAIPKAYMHGDTAFGFVVAGTVKVGSRLDMIQITWDYQHFIDYLLGRLDPRMRGLLQLQPVVDGGGHPNEPITIEIPIQFARMLAAALDDGTVQGSMARGLTIYTEMGNGMGYMGDHVQAAMDRLRLPKEGG